MRESSLFTFSNYSGDPSDPNATPSVFISVPAPASSHGLQSNSSWSGLQDGLIAWRVIRDNTLHLEHIVSHNALAIVFSASLSTRPLFLPPDSPDSTVFPLIVACYSQATGSTLLHISVSRDLHSAAAQPHLSEENRFFLPGVKVTMIQHHAPYIIVALCDGRCIRVSLDQADANIQSNFSIFSPPPLPHSALRQSELPMESPSFVSRWLKPSGFDLMRSHHFPIPFSSPSAGLLPTYTGPKDPILAIAPLYTPYVVTTLHQSGRVCLFVNEAASYVFIADVILPCKLSTTSKIGFLLPGPDASLLALVMADEHPKTDSLRVFELSIDFPPGGPFSLSCRQLVNREGPIPPIIAATYFAEDIVVATRSGLVTALLNEPRHALNPGDHEGSNFMLDLGDAEVEPQAMSRRPIGTLPRKGLPGRTLWTALDDVDEPYGLGRAIDALQLEDHGSLLNAHRFSTRAVAKALRLAGVEDISRDNLCDALSQVNITDRDVGLRRIKQRAEHFTKQEDLRVRDLEWDESVGLVVVRETGLYVVRPLFEAEKRVFVNYEDLLGCDQETPTGATAWMLASNAICQNLSAQYVDGISRNDDTSKLAFIFKLAIQFSKSNPRISLTDLICTQQALDCVNCSKPPTFPEVMEKITSILQPGASLLSILMSLCEYDALAETSMQCANLLPVSTAFANGYVWLERFRLDVGETKVDIDLSTPDQVMGEGHKPPTKLDKAYGFFALAAQTFLDEASLEDTICALDLAGFPTLQRPEHGTEADEDENWRNWAVGIPDGEANVENVILGDCAFWLLERAVHMLESAELLKSAAMLAIEAMKCAPSYEKHEQMRSKAFNHLLDVSELELALRALLSKPFDSRNPYEYNLEDAEAMRDSIGEFITKSAENNMLKWLADQHIPEPLSALCGQALERRARSSKPIKFRSVPLQAMEVSFVEATSEKRVGDEYSDLFAWYIMRNDEPSAASCALEWSERLSLEGPEILHDAVKTAKELHSGVDVNEMYLKFLLIWAQSKFEALSWVQAAMRVKEENHFVVRSKLFLSGFDAVEDGEVVVDKQWVSRRLLLSHAQVIYLRDEWDKLLNGMPGVSNIDHLKMEWSPLLVEGRSGVEWASSRLRQRPTYNNMLLCVELCTSWWGELGNGCLTDVVSEAARAAARSETKTFGFNDLRRLLHSVIVACERVGSGKKNWYTLALECTLSACAGETSCPKWLINASAHGVSREADRKLTHSTLKGDMLGTVRAFLQNSRPIDAVNVISDSLLMAESALRFKETGNVYISYTAIDATLEILLHTAYLYPEAKTAYRELSAKVRNYMEAVQQRQLEMEKKFETNLKRDVKSGALTSSMPDTIETVKSGFHDEMDVAL